MGGGSSVMGMVAYRGTPDDYANGKRTAPPAGAGDDVLPFFRKLTEPRWISTVEMHGQTGRCRSVVPPMEDWAPLSKAVHAYGQERQIPFTPT